MDFFPAEVADGAVEEVGGVALLDVDLLSEAFRALAVAAAEVELDGFLSAAGFATLSAISDDSGPDCCEEVNTCELVKIFRQGLD